MTWTHIAIELFFAATGAFAVAVIVRSIKEVL